MLVHLTGLFWWVGLEMNASKMKALIGDNGVAITHLMTPTYTQKLSGIGESYSARKHQKVTCGQCGAEMQEQALVKHLLRAHGKLHWHSKHHKVL